MGNTSGLAITALVLGIVALMLSFIPILNILLCIAAITFGIIGLNSVKKTGQEGRGMAIAGIVLGGVAIVISLISFIGMMAYFGVLNPQRLIPERCTTSSGFTCIGSPFGSEGSSRNVIDITYTIASGMGSTLTCDATRTEFSGTISGCTTTICDQSSSNCETSKKIADGETKVIKLTGCTSSNEETYRGNVKLTCMNDRSGLYELVTTDIVGEIRR